MIYSRRARNNYLISYVTQLSASRSVTVVSDYSAREGEGCKLTKGGFAHTR
jgi:phosphatidate phosphatase PAH1